jgi:hypothetical protein
MFATPLREKSKRGRVAKAVTMPAPTKGWYVGQALADAPVGTAYILENFFPAADYVRLRAGSRQYAANMVQPIYSLMTYKSGTLERMFASTLDRIFDVSGGGIITSAAVTGLTSGNWQWMNFTGAGGTYLVAVNGSDVRRLFDGTNWTTSPAITGVDSATLVNCWTYKGRQYFIQENSLSAWYLAADAIGGAATELPLGADFPSGGYLVAGASWAVATNGGLQDVCVFVSSEGEVLAYTGSSPSDSATWSRVGLYKVGRPLGYRCLFKAGGDVAVLCEDGIIPLSKAVNYDRAALIDTAITKPIAPEFQRLTKGRFTEPLWSMTGWPSEQMFLVTVPQSSTQLVSNLVTGAWCKFTGWQANCFAVYKNRLFFGTDLGTVNEAYVGAADVGDPGDVVTTDGARWGRARWGNARWGNPSGTSGQLALSNAPYTGTMFWSFTDMKAPAVMKLMGMGRVNAQSNLELQGTKLTIKKDYDFTVPSAPGLSNPILSGARWGVAKWGRDKWPTRTSFSSNRWRGLTGFGTMVAPVYQVTVATVENVEVKVTSIDMTYESGEAFG